MKLLRLLPVACIAIFSAGFTALSAQSVAITGGHMTLGLTGYFQQQLNSSGVTLTLNGYGDYGFAVAAGTIDASDAEGSVTTDGYILFTQGSKHVRLTHMQLSNDAPTPVLTADVLVDGVDQGVEPVFTFTTADAEYNPRTGVVTVDSACFVVNPSFAARLKRLAGASFDPQEELGSVSLRLKTAQ